MRKGCPSQGLTPYGSFEAWSDLIRNALVWLGEADPCEGRKDLAAQTDEKYEQLARLLATWDACFPTKTDGTPQQKTLNEIKQEIALYAANKDQVPNTWDQLRDALVPFDRRSDGKSLNTHLIGNALRAIEGRVIGKKRLKRCGERHKTALWRLEIV
jgi:putative DNA primase/helicase